MIKITGVNKVFASGEMSWKRGVLFFFIREMQIESFELQNRPKNNIFNPYLKHKMIRNLLIFGILFFTNQLLGQSTVLIQDAVDRKMIEYRISGSWNSSNQMQFLDADGQYFGKCMTIKIRSKVDSTNWINITNGLMLMCEDTTTQDMVITKTVFVKLAPRESTTVQLYAMCSEIHDAMPNSETFYSIGEMSDSNLVAITKSIDQMFMHNVVGQGAVWAYTDSATEPSLRRYGATDASLELTIQVLNKAGVSTLLNPPKFPEKDSANEVAVPIAAATTSNHRFILLNANIVYLASAVILLLFGTTLFLLIKRRKRSNDNHTLT